MKILLSFTLLFLLIFTSCKKTYTCICEDKNDDEHTETGTYLGNDADGYLINVEGQLVKKNGYESCECNYD